MSHRPWYQRPVDALLILSFVAFCGIAVTFDRAAGLDLVAPDSPDLFGRMLWEWGVKYDPLVAANPLALRIMSAISAFLYGPFYLVLIWALMKQRNWIRIPAIVYGSTILYSMLVHVLAEFMYETPPPSMTVFLIAYGGYALIPALLLWRMRGEPFPGEPG